MAGGRKRDQAWEYFQKVLLPMAKHAKCKHCSEEIQGLVVSVKQHQESCDGDNKRNMFEQEMQILIIPL